VQRPRSDLVAVARLRLPEKIARTLTEAELPVLDRPLRFVVLRGQRGAVRARTLDELQEALDRPWSPDEVDAREAREAEAFGASPAEREARAVAKEFRRNRDGHRGGGNGGGGPRGRNRYRSERRGGAGGGRGGEGRGGESRSGEARGGSGAPPRGRRRRPKR
jgi:hypothetical protein